MRSIQTLASSEASGPCHSTTQTHKSSRQTLRSRKAQPGFWASSCHAVGLLVTVVGEPAGFHPMGSSAGNQWSSTRTTAAEGPSSSEAPCPPLGPGAIWSKSKEYRTVEMFVMREPTRSRRFGSERFVDACQPGGIVTLQGTSSETKSPVTSPTSRPVQPPISTVMMERTAMKRAMDTKRYTAPTHNVRRRDVGERRRRGRRSGLAGLLSGRDPDLIFGTNILRPGPDDPRSPTGSARFHVSRPYGTMIPVFPLPRLTTKLEGPTWAQTSNAPPDRSPPSCSRRARASV
jgi:hypothetical protein